MSEREEAIKKILGDGDELTEENILAAIKPAEKKAPDTNREVIETLQAISNKLNQVIDAVNAQGSREIKIPDIKVPEMKVPAPTIIQPQKDKRKFTFDFTYDQNGNIISAQATEE